MVYNSLAPINDFFLRIERVWDATQVLVGVVVFLLALEVQLCLSVKDVTYKKRDAKT
jgi:hypothetical protein